eukprot:8887791-Karenia_brevis.AAC.1
MKPPVGPPISVCDLFCGIGSWSVAFQRLKWNIVKAMDIDASLGPLYMKNFGAHFIQADMTHLREAMFLHTLNLHGASIGPP